MAVKNPQGGPDTAQAGFVWSASAFFGSPCAALFSLFLLAMNFKLSPLRARCFSSLSALVPLGWSRRVLPALALGLVTLGMAQAAPTVHDTTPASTHTYTVPAGVTAVKVVAIGGGGGAGGACVGCDGNAATGAGWGGNNFKNDSCSGR